MMTTPWLPFVFAGLSDYISISKIISGKGFVSNVNVERGSPPLATVAGTQIDRPIGGNQAMHPPSSPHDMYAPH